MTAGARAGASGVEHAVLPIGAAPETAARGVGRRGRVVEEEVNEGKKEQRPKEEFGDGKMVTKAVNVKGFVHFLEKVIEKS